MIGCLCNRPSVGFKVDGEIDFPFVDIPGSSSRNTSLNSARIGCLSRFS